MITEQELELALELRDKIKELKVTIAKLEQVVISSTNNLSGGITIDSIKIATDEYTRNTLHKFKEDILTHYKERLQDLKDKYKEIIETPDDAFRRILEEQDDDN